MLVEMVRLRSEGVKLTREQVRAAPVWRNELWMYRIDGTVRAIFGSESNYLEPAAIIVMRGTDFLVVGMETIGMWGAQREVPQAWWCRLIPSRAPEAKGSGLHFKAEALPLEA
jgi:hypothetical protein